MKTNIHHVKKHTAEHVAHHQNQFILHQTMHEDDFDLLPWSPPQMIAFVYGNLHIH